MDETESSIEILERALKADWLNIRKSREATSQSRAKLVRAFKGLVAPDTSLVLFGSIARQELTSGSDTDCLYNPHVHGTPWSTIALGSLLLISACLTRGQEVQSPQPEKPKPPVKMEQRGRILGIGGIFFKSANRDQMREWYSKHLGLADKGGGAMLPWREHDDPQKKHVTVWTILPTSSNYLDPSHAPFMINYIVDDLDALLDRLKQEGVKIDAKRMNESYGRFAWIYDLDGNKIELWQPPSAKP